MPAESLVLVPGLDATSMLVAAGRALLEAGDWPLLAARCDGIGNQYLNALCEGELMGAGTGIFFDTMGPLFPVMLALIFLPGSYVLSGDLALPLTLMVFIGAMMGTFLPGIFSFLGVFVVAVGIGIALFIPIHRLRRES